MSRQLVINGVPDCIRQDGWWLACDSANAADDSDRDRVPRPAIFVKRHPWAFPVLVLLTLLADWLFWQQSLGNSLALFALALSSSILALKPGAVSRRETVTAFTFELVCNLPLVEQLHRLTERNLQAQRRQSEYLTHLGAHSHRQRSQTKPDRRSATLELRRQRVIGAALTLPEPFAANCAVVAFNIGVMLGARYPN